MESLFWVCKLNDKFSGSFHGRIMLCYTCYTYRMLCYTYTLNFPVDSASKTRCALHLGLYDILVTKRENREGRERGRKSDRGFRVAVVHALCFLLRILTNCLQCFIRGEYVTTESLQVLVLEIAVQSPFSSHLECFFTATVKKWSWAFVRIPAVFLQIGKNVKMTDFTFTTQSKHVRIEFLSSFHILKFFHILKNNCNSRNFEQVQVKVCFEQSHHKFNSFILSREILGWTK